MNATVRYEMRFQTSKWTRSGEKAWNLYEVMKPEFGPETWTEIAIFNLDSEAERFMGNMFAGSSVKLPKEIVELFQSQKER